MAEVTANAVNEIFLELFQELGLSRNEAKIYGCLLESGESSVGEVATAAGVHRRNVYDVLYRLLEKGLIFEIIQGSENRYQAVDPHKLQDLVIEEEQVLSEALPGLKELYEGTPEVDEVLVYRGVEGWKRYMRDIIRVGEDFYSIAGKGAWLDQRMRKFFPWFMQEIKGSGITLHHLFDHEVKEAALPIVDFVGECYKFLPKEYSAPAAIDVFGDHVNIALNRELEAFESEYAFTVVVNRSMAESFRTWFRYMWDFCPEST